MALTTVTPPAAQVVAVDDLKAELRIDFETEDELLSGYVDVATARAQSYSRRQFITATFKQTERYPCGEVILEKSPLQEIVSVLDGDGNEIEYTLDDTRPCAVIVPESSPERLVVTFTAGYGDSAADVPTDAVHAVRIAAGHYWRTREIGAALPQAFYDLLASVKVRRVV